MSNERLESSQLSPSMNAAQSRELSQLVFAQMTSHAQDSAACRSAKAIDDSIALGQTSLSGDGLRHAVLQDLATDAGALGMSVDKSGKLHSSKAAEAGSDRATMAKDQKIIDFAQHLLDRSTKDDLQLTSNQAKDLRDLIAAEQQDIANSRSDIPDEKAYVQQDQQLLADIRNHSVTSSEVNQFVRSRQKDSANEAKYIADNQTASDALSRVVLDFHLHQS